MTSPAAVRFFIIGLPVGLIISGIIAMFIYFDIEAREEAQSARVPVRRPVTQADLEAQVRTFSAGIGPRNSATPGSLASAQKYIQSTLGPANLGYRVSRQDYQINGVDYYNLVINLPGTDENRWDETVIVCANYDTVTGSPGANDNASGMAALMSLAQTFAGTKNTRTLQFVALVNEAPPFAGTGETGSAAYVQHLKTTGEKVMAVFSLESLGNYTDAPGSQRLPAGPAAPPAWPETGSFLTLLAIGEPSRPVLEESLPEFQKASALPVRGMTVSPDAALAGRAARTFQQAGFPSVRVTDTAELRTAPAAETAVTAPETAPADTMDRLDFPRLTLAVQGLEAMLKDLVNPAPEGVR